jgi:four helix bundle protein
MTSEDVTPEPQRGQTNPEQSRFLGIALRSLLETVACQNIIERRKYLDMKELKIIYEVGQKLFAKIQAMRNTLDSD